MSKKFALIPSNWEYLHGKLSVPFASLEDVHEILRSSSENEDLELKGLNAMNFDSADKVAIFNFIRIQSLRISDPVLFRSPFLNILQSGKDSIVSFSREQLLVLLCHMTLLTFKVTSHHIYWITFENWLTDGRPCAMAYLRGLFSYFSDARTRIDTNWKHDIVTFERKTYFKDIFPLPDIELKKIDLHLNGSIGDYSRIVIDFANQDIGFGIGGTQEEIIFGSFLELCPAMIFCGDSMKNDEAIIFRNVLKYASYSGYGFNLLFQEREHNDHLAVLPAFDVIAIDALDFSGDYHQALPLQLEMANLERELRKLIAGFSCFTNEVIDTGHWGCGAFGGNKCIKSLLQMIAATLTNNTLSFCCFSDDKFFNSCNLILSKLPYSIQNIWTIISTISLDPRLIDY